MEEKRGGHCDLCHANLQIGETIYVHGTPSTGTYEEAQASTDVAWFEDPHWAVCLPCHRRVLALDAGQLSVDEWGVVQTKRALRNQVITPVNMPPEEQFALYQAQVESVMEVLAAFARHHVPEWYEEINEGV